MSNIRALVVASGLVGLIGPAAAAQGGTGYISVRPNVGTASREGFTVCTGIANSRSFYGTKVTGSTGNVTFDGIPNGTGLVTTVTKSGYAGSEAIWQHPGPGSFPNVVIYMFPGSGGPSCGTAAPVPAPPPTTTTLVVFVVRDTDGVAIPGAQVCVGTGPSLATFAAVKTAGTSGRVVFSGLPYPQTFAITASKGGYIGGVTSTSYGTTLTATIRLRPGAGGPICPGALVQPDLTQVAAVAPDPPRLLEEMLAVRGDQGMHSMQNTKYTCRKLGANYVLTGLRIRHKVTSLIGFDLYCAPLRADGTLGPNIFLPAQAPTGGTAQQTVCASGQAVAGYQGTLSTDATIRSLRLRCAALGPTGLISGSSTLHESLGIQSGGAWGPDTCTQNRPASALATHNALRPPDPFYVASIHSIQLICEQPQRPLR